MGVQKEDVPVDIGTVSKTVVDVVMDEDGLATGVLLRPLTRAVTGPYGTTTHGTHPSTRSFRLSFPVSREPEGLTHL